MALSFDPAQGLPSPMLLDCTLTMFDSAKNVPCINYLMLIWLTPNDHKGGIDGTAWASLPTRSCVFRSQPDKYEFHYYRREHIVLVK
jgi:hypothetical protein